MHCFIQSISDALTPKFTDAPSNEKDLRKLLDSIIQSFILDMRDKPNRGYKRRKNRVIMSTYNFYFIVFVPNALFYAISL